MRLVVLTTDTPCHAQFVADTMHMHRDSTHVIWEKERPLAPWWAEHELDRHRDQYEKERFGLDQRVLGVGCDVENVNGRVGLITRMRPDVVIVYGTGKLSPEVIATCPQMFNLHGADAEMYRGLDGAYWAIYWGDFDAIAVTLHRVEPTLDTGEIVSKRKIPLRPGMGVHELRAEAALLCNEMVADLLDDIEHGRLKTRPQRGRKARYFSFMPACLKSHVERKFKEHVNGMATD